MKVEVKSAGFECGNDAEIFINSCWCRPKENESGHLRGLEILIFDPFGVRIKSCQVFDTYKSSDALEAFI